MNNVIVPIDFSETSKNAARYAAHIANLIPDAHLILYNVFDALEYGSDSSPLGTEGEEDASRKAIVELALESVRTEISAITNARISVVAEELWLPAVMEALVSRGITRLLVEGGPRIWRSFADAALVDEVILYMAGAPSDTAAMDAVARHLGPVALSLVDRRPMGSDTMWRLHRVTAKEGR